MRASGCAAASWPPPPPWPPCVSRAPRAPRVHEAGQASPSSHRVPNRARLVPGPTASTVCRGAPSPNRRPRPRLPAASSSRLRCRRAPSCGSRTNTSWRKSCGHCCPGHSTVCQRTGTPPPCQCHLRAPSQMFLARQEAPSMHAMPCKRAPNHGGARRTARRDSRVPLRCRPLIDN